MEKERLSWEDVYPNTELRDARKFYTYFFRKQDLKERMEKQKKGIYFHEFEDNNY